MMERGIDIRWRQRFDNYKRAYNKLAVAVEKVLETSCEDADVAELLNEGLIQRFEYTHELAWNVMKDYEMYQGDFDIKGSRDAMRKALAIGLIDDPSWLESINDRNRTSHNYDEETAQEIRSHIINLYFPLLTKFRDRMLEIESQEG